MSEISLADLRAYIGPHPDLYDFTLPGGTIRALIDTAEAAQALNRSLTLNTYTSSDLRERLRQSLARYTTE